MAKVQKKELLIKISPSILFYVFLFFAAIWFFEKIRNILFISFVAYIISVGLNKPICKIQDKFHWKRSVSSIFVYFIFITIVGIFLAIIVPPLAREFSVMLSTFKLPPEIDRMLDTFELNLQDVSRLTSQWGGSLSTAISVISSTFSGALTVIMTLVISLYISIEKGQVVRDFSWLTQDKKKIKQFEEATKEINVQLGNWIRGEFILMIIVGALVFIATALIGLPYSLPLALLAGLMEIIPNIGPTVSAIPAIFIALITLGWPGAIITLALYIIIQQLENNLIVPRIMQRSVNVSGLTVILGILIGGTIFGVAGALLAVPAIIVFRTVFETWIKYKPEGGLI
ncbi:MAG: AI-2E family transporter [Candidatus Pacebacteria bacterium]|jgi:predicted PurR-regulated permease PerM|nr:AI-2E family transporter [Candidatus Paceibacterota bacterium]